MAMSNELVSVRYMVDDVERAVDFSPNSSASSAV
jgi:hypothetical protein